MTLSAVRSNDAALNWKSGATNLGRNKLFRLQLAQREHDEKYHPEISRLPLHHRLNHMALHFAKYAGRLARALREENGVDVPRTMTDIFIISMSCANALNIDLGDYLIEENISSENTPATASGRQESQTLQIELLLDVTDAAGRMAKACETVDHLEAFPFREQMSQSTVDLAKISLAYMQSRCMDPADEVFTRLEGVRRKKIFHGHI